jgi:hypothetical protein
MNNVTRLGSAASAAQEGRGRGRVGRSGVRVKSGAWSRGGLGSNSRFPSVYHPRSRRRAADVVVVVAVADGPRILAFQTAGARRPFTFGRLFLSPTASFFNYGGETPVLVAPPNRYGAGPGPRVISPFLLSGTAP